MSNTSPEIPDGVWIVQAQNTDDEGRIVAVCATAEAAEKVSAELSGIFPDLAYARFPVGYRFGQQRH